MSHILICPPRVLRVSFGRSAAADQRSKRVRFFSGHDYALGDECLCYTNVYYVYPPCTFTDWMAMVLAADKYLESFC